MAMVDLCMISKLESVESGQKAVETLATRSEQVRRLEMTPDARLFLKRSGEDGRTQMSKKLYRSLPNA